MFIMIHFTKTPYCIILWEKQKPEKGSSINVVHYNTETGCRVVYMHYSVMLSVAINFTSFRIKVMDYFM